jgi:hypothetical protein
VTGRGSALKGCSDEHKKANASSRYERMSTSSDVQLAAKRIRDGQLGWIMLDFPVMPVPRERGDRSSTWIAHVADHLATAI